MKTIMLPVALSLAVTAAAEPIVYPSKGQLEQYDRAYGTCLTGRGYTVSQ